MWVDEPKLGQMRFDSAPSKYSFGVCFAKGLAMLVTTFSDQPPLRKNTQWTFIAKFHFLPLNGRKKINNK